MPPNVLEQRETLAITDESKALKRSNIIVRYAFFRTRSLGFKASHLMDDSGMTFVEHSRRPVRWNRDTRGQ